MEECKFSILSLQCLNEIMPMIKGKQFFQKRTGFAKFCVNRSAFNINTASLIRTKQFVTLVVKVRIKEVLFQNNSGSITVVSI